MKQVYVGCALTHVPKVVFDEYCGFIRSIAQLLEEKYCVRVKYALEDSDPFLPEYAPAERPKMCYIWDRRLVEESSILIAEVSFPSMGIGIELQVAEQNSIPVILLYRDFGFNRAEGKKYKTRDDRTHELQIGNKIVSIMAQGNPSVIKEIFYSTYSDCLNSLNVLLSQVKHIYLD